MPISGRRAVGGPARPIELSIVARPALVPWRYPPSIEFQYGDWMRAELERGDLPEWPRPDPDVAVLVETAFISNRGEERRLASARYQEEVAAGIARAVNSFARSSEHVAAAAEP